MERSVFRYAGNSVPSKLGSQSPAGSDARGRVEAFKGLGDSAPPQFYTPPLDIDDEA
ncbi:hypothetical protein SNK03_006541 [Fusarium graminearum]